MKYIIIFFNKIKWFILTLLHKNISIKSCKLYQRCLIQCDKKGKIHIDKNFLSRSDLKICCQGGKIEIGKNVFTNTNVSIIAKKNIEIGEKTIIGQNVVIIDHDHDFRSHNNDNFICKEIIIGKNVWIGANSVILMGSEIGDNCVIAAGSIVKGEVQPNTIFVQKRTAEYINIK